MNLNKFCENFIGLKVLILVRGGVVVSIALVINLFFNQI